MSLSPGQGAKRRHSRNSMQDDGKAADSASGATPATAGVPAFHKRHGTFDSKLFRIFRTLSDGKSDPQQQAISNLDSRIIRMGASKK